MKGPEANVVSRKRIQRFSYIIKEYLTAGEMKLPQPVEEKYSGVPDTELYTFYSSVVPEHTRPVEKSEQAGPSSILEDNNYLPPATTADCLS
ncbi:hypothetical protein PoB_002066900 [Plakobranchus ocellatus]|uniref:Uncharacterized protein n=1 Tax=Plakobranchus ocellatus TaxID=259542 RepID=A0AAV3ZJU8_9GAST|nr:hypothetical protein PoB_002066900 [Plakobranchus ocellatus]